MLVIDVLNGNSKHDSMQSLTAPLGSLGPRVYRREGRQLRGTVYPKIRMDKVLAYSQLTNRYWPDIRFCELHTGIFTMHSKYF